MSQITWSTEPGLGAVPVPILSERQAPLQKRPRPTGGTSPPPVTATHCGAGSSCPERSPESQAASRRRESPRRQSQGTSRDVSDHRPKPRERAKLGRADTSSEWTRHPVEPGRGGRGDACLCPRRSAGGWSGNLGSACASWLEDALSSHHPCQPTPGVVWMLRKPGSQAPDSPGTTGPMKGRAQGFSW